MAAFSTSIPKKKENIRVFVQRKRLSSHKSTSIRSDSFRELTSNIDKHLNKKNKNIILVNYKPVYIHSREQKSVTIPSTTTTTSQSHPRQCNTTTISNSNGTKQSSAPINVPDVEDPFMFIEMMYQQLFTEDGQLRNGTQPEVLANCVKQIVTQSRRNSMALRDSTIPNSYQRKYSMPSKAASVSSLSSPHLISNIFSEEEEEEESRTLRQRTKTINTSTRSSKRSSIDHTDHQHLHAFLNSYHHHHHQKRPSTNQTRLTSDPLFAVDDTDNEDLDTFSDFNSSRRTIRPSPPISADEDATHTDSKLLSSSGYYSLTTQQRVPIIKSNINAEHNVCSNCSQTSQTSTTPSTSIINIIQPIRDLVTKYLDFILVSKNILIIPLFIFLLHQRSIPMRS